MQSSTTFAVLRPKVQVPGLVIRQNTSDSINNAVSPRIDRSGLNFRSIRQCLTRKGEQQAIKIHCLSNAETFDFMHTRFRRSTP